jgi:hypothetical protein
VVLIIGALAALVFGLGLTLGPAQMLAGFGVGAPTPALILSRDVGVTLLGLAVLNWLGRNATGDALRAILAGNLFVQVAEFVVNGLEIATGDLPSAAAGGLIIHVVLGALFAWALYQSRRAPGTDVAEATAPRPA